MTTYQKHFLSLENKPTFLLELMFLSIISLLILIIGLQITPGITPDSIMKFLPISENIFHQGIGWFLYNNSYETTIIPPLYEFLSAFVMIFGFDVIRASGLVSLISFAFLPIPLYYLGKEIGGVSIGLLTVIFCCIMKPFWDSATSSMTDMLFLFLIVSSMCFFSRYIISKNFIDLVLFSFFLVCANWTRWLGTAWLITYILILTLLILQKKINKQHFGVFLFLSIPLILILYLRNIFLVGEVFKSEIIPFSIINIFVNIGMIGINIIWDFIGFNPLKGANQTLLDLYFNSFSNIQFDYLPFFESIHISIFQVVSLIIGLVLVLSLISLLFIFFNKQLLPFFKSILFENQWIPILFCYIFFYLGMFLYTESTSKQVLIDSRYLLPIYPLIIIAGLKGVFFLTRVESPFQKIGHVILIACIIIFILWQLSGTFIYLSHIQHGRDFSDPTLMEGPAYQWLQQNTNQSTPIIINDGFRGYFWDKSLNRSLIRMPTRYYPIQKYLMEQSPGTYFVITPVIGTKRPYRWNDLKPYLLNSSRYIQILAQNDDYIFQIKD